MIAAIQMQLDAAKSRTTAPAPAKGTQGPPAPVASAVGLRNTPKEQPGAKPCPVRWNEAGGLFSEQHPGMSRIVVSCHETDSARVVAALNALNP